MQEQQAGRRRHDEVLADIARFAGSSLEIEDVLTGIVRLAAELTGADRSSIWLLDRSGRRLLPSALYGMDEAFTAGWKRRPLRVQDEPLSREALETGEPVVVADAFGDPRTDKGSVEFFGDKSILVAPLLRRGRAMGTLFLNHVRAPYRFTDEDVDTTLVIANQAAIAIDNARLYGDTRRLAEQLRRSFRNAGEALAAGFDVTQTLQLMVQLATETVQADGGSIRLLDEAGRGTYLVASCGSDRLPDAANAEFPLVAGGRRLGTIALWRHAPEFDREERELLGAFADHARTAVEHARLYARLQEEQERAQQAERTQSEFVSMVSHELRTPLALIKGYVMTLLRPGLTLPEERRRSFLEGIDGAADRLRKLIDNLLSVTSLEAGQFVTHFDPLELSSLLRNALGEAAVLARARQINLAPPETDLWILGDAHQLTQVVQNLIANADKYAPGGSPVTVSAAQATGKARISVCDSGPGIPPDALELIFEKFYRVPLTAEGAALPAAVASLPEPARRRPSGLGLGLYICRRIVEAHGGRIWAENLPEGGAAFHVELPLGVVPRSPTARGPGTPAVLVMQADGEVKAGAS